MSSQERNSEPSRSPERKGQSFQARHLQQPMAGDAMKATASRCCPPKSQQ
jgi:hypothetical protein